MQFFSALSAIYIYLQKPRIEERVLAQLRRFVDVEAEVADDDEDEDESSDLEDFIDDGEPSHEPPAELRRRAELLALQTPSEEAEELEAVAQRFVDRCRRETVHRASTPELSAPGSKHGLPSAPPSTAKLLDAPLYMCKVRPTTELQLIQFLMAYENVHSVFTRALGSGAVYVECSDAQNLDGAMREYEAFYHLRHIFPRKIDVVEMLPFILFPPALDTLYGTWKRLSKPCGTLAAFDLVLVVDSGTLLGIPRIPYRKSKTVRNPSSTNPAPAPQEPFSPKKFKEFFPHKRLEKRNKIYSWSTFTWNAAGLELLSWSDDRDVFSRTPAIPTEAERAMFAHANDPSLDLPYSGRTCALQEGDRVVVGSERDGFQPGFLQGIVERSSRAHPEKVVRYAAVKLQSEVVPDIAIDALVNSLRGNDTLILPLYQLRLHILAPLRTISLGDRVVIVGGNQARGASGRVRDISAEGMVTIHLPELEVAMDIETLDIEIRFIQHDFRVGDVLKVIRGPHSGAVGFVLAVNPGGSIELFLVGSLSSSSSNLNVC